MTAEALDNLFGIKLVVICIATKLITWWKATCILRLSCFWLLDQVEWSETNISCSIIWINLKKGWKFLNESGEIFTCFQVNLELSWVGSKIVILLLSAWIHISDSVDLTSKMTCPSEIKNFILLVRELMSASPWPLRICFVLSKTPTIVIFSSMVWGRSVQFAKRRYSG